MTHSLIYLSGNRVEQRGHVTHVGSGEDGVEHLALFLVARSVCRKKTGSEGELDEAVQSVR